jgi:glyoxylase-like metal-dependent hydrolase (beta-lactamase superfamily II)
MQMFELERLEVGPWPMNCYLLRCVETGVTAIVDPGADAETILRATGKARVATIFLTHAHPDHIGALEEVRAATGASVALHAADVDAWDVQADVELHDDGALPVGHGTVRIVHAPGHTPGSCLLRLEDRALVGDAIFPGGPGHTTSPRALAQSLDSLARTVFAWPDETKLYPGHGPHTTVGAERAAFSAFVGAERAPDLCGDLTWEMR